MYTSHDNHYYNTIIMFILFFSFDFVSRKNDLELTIYLQIIVSQMFYYIIAVILTITTYYVIICCIILYHILYYIISYYIISYHIVLYYIILCHQLLMLPFRKEISLYSTTHLHSVHQFKMLTQII